MHQALHDKSNTGNRARAVFFGTPVFAVPAMRTLAAMVDIDLSLVVTQPDRPAGRRQQLRPSPVKVAAEELGIPTYQPSSLRTALVRDQLASLDADVFVVAAYGQVFGPKLLAVPARGCVNLHASLLPAYRGASPISAAILHGDEVTGVSLMEMEPGLDAGPVLATSKDRIRGDDTTETLTERLAEMAADLLESNISAYVRGELIAHPQGTGATMTRSLVKADGLIDWTQPAGVLERHVRAMWPWPRAWTTLRRGDDSVAMQVHKATCIAGLTPADNSPGLLMLQSGQAIVNCGRDRLVLETVQMAGGRPQPGTAIPGLTTSSDGLRLGEDQPLAGRRPLITRAEGEVH